MEVLESLTSTFPNKNGVANGWKFEKAHSILHKVRELILFGWSEDFSTQGPEHCHIDFIKKIGNCTNNKEVFLTILRHHVREGHLQYLRELRADIYAEDNADLDETFTISEDVATETAKNDSVPCELGLSYPLLQSIMQDVEHTRRLRYRDIV